MIQGFLNRLFNNLMNQFLFGFLGSLLSGAAPEGLILVDATIWAMLARGTNPVNPEGNAILFSRFKVFH
jgi:hypothetical protein